MANLPPIMETQKSREEILMEIVRAPPLVPVTDNLNCTAKVCAVRPDGALEIITFIGDSMSARTMIVSLYGCSIPTTAHVSPAIMASMLSCPVFTESNAAEVSLRVMREFMINKLVLIRFVAQHDQYGRVTCHLAIIDNKNNEIDGHTMNEWLICNGYAFLNRRLHTQSMQYLCANEFNRCCDKRWHGRDRVSRNCPDSVKWNWANNGSI